MAQDPGDSPPSPVGDDVSARRQLQDGAIRGATWTVIHTLVSLPVAFLANLIVARVLGVVDYGRLAFLTALMEVAYGVITLGFGVALVQFGSKAHAAGRHDEVRRMLSAAQGFRLLVAAPLLTVLVLVVADVEPLMMVMAVVFGILVPSAFDGATACLFIENKSAAGAKIALVIALVTQLAVVVVALVVRTADSVWAARLVVGGAGVALALFPIAASYRRAVLRPRLPRGFPAGFWRFTIPFALASVVGSLVLSRSEIFVMQWLANPAALGLFALAFGVAGHVFAPAQAFIGPLVPAVSSLHEVDTAAVAPAFTRTLRAGSTVVALLMASALAALALLVPVLYGEEFRDASPLVLALGIASGLLVVGSPVTAFVSARLSAWELLRANLVALVLDIAVAIALIPVWGAWGAVVANVVGATTRLMLLMRREITLLGLPWRTVARESAPVGLGAIACVIAWFTAGALPWSPVAAAAAAAVLGVLVLVVVLRSSGTGLTEDDAVAVARGAPAPLRTPSASLLRLLTHRR